MMKISSLSRKIGALVLALLTAGGLASCGGADTDMPPPLSTDVNYTEYRQSDSVDNVFLETPAGSYYLANYYVYFAEHGCLDYIKLCGKPDCTHDTEDCNAYIDSLRFAYYDGYIYYYVMDYSKVGYYLCRMNMDGTEHTELKWLCDASGVSACSGFFDNGYLYFATSGMGVVGNSQSKFYYTALDDDKAPEELVSTADIGDYMEVIPHSGSLYFCTYYTSDEVIIQRYMIDSGKWSTIEGWSLYGSYFGDDKAYCYKPSDGFYEYDYDTETMTRVKEADFLGRSGAYYQKDYIYVVQASDTKIADTETTFYIYDRSYNLVDSITMDMPRTDFRATYFYADTGDYILLCCDFTDLTAPDYYLKKSEIGTGNMQLYKMG